MIDYVKPGNVTWRITLMIFNQEGKVLVLKDSDGLWDRVTGLVLTDESPTQAVNRLSAEILNLSLYTIQSIKTLPTVEGLNFVFKSTITEKDSLLSKTTCEYLWELFSYLCNYDNVTLDLRDLVNLYNRNFFETSSYI
jgi:hypothetical protein